MAKRPLWYEKLKGCKRKKFFETEKIANDYARVILKQFQKMKSYKCKFCVGWHVTKDRSNK